MLLRMYVRWGEKQGNKTRVVEKSLGEEAGKEAWTRPRGYDTVGHGKFQKTRTWIWQGYDMIK